MTFLRRPRPPKLSYGEVACPRKGNPFPAVISVTSCVQYHRQAHHLCEEHSCRHYLAAEREVAALNRLLEPGEDGVIPAPKIRRQGRSLALVELHEPVEHIEETNTPAGGDAP